MTDLLISAQFTPTVTADERLKSAVAALLRDPLQNPRWTVPKGEALMLADKSNPLADKRNGRGPDWRFGLNLSRPQRPRCSQGLLDGWQLPCRLYAEQRRACRSVFRSMAETANCGLRGGSKTRPAKSKRASSQRC